MKTRAERPAFWAVLVMGMILMTGGTGCAALVISATGTDAHELALPTTRAEVHHRFGQPKTTEVGPEGVAIDTYHLRKKLGVPDAPRWVRQVSMGPDDALLLCGTWLILNVLTYGAPEVALAGVQYYRSVRDGYEIAYVYDTQERILVYYPVSTSPADRLLATERQLTRRLLDALDANEAPLGPAVDGHVVGLRRWAEYLGVLLPTESEAALERARALAAEADGGERHRADALADMKTCLLSGCLAPASANAAPESQQGEKGVAGAAAEPL